MANTIEVMLEALRSCTEDADGQHFHHTQVQEAIAAGEAELRSREPELCTVCGEGKASLIVLRTCDKCESEYEGKYEMDLEKKLREEIK